MRFGGRGHAARGIRADCIAWAVVWIALAVPIASADDSVLCASISTPPGALYIYSDVSNTTFTGNNFWISGDDFNFSDGLPGPMSAIWGVAARTELNAEEMRNSLSTSQMDNIQGRGYVAGSPATPSIGVVPVPDPAQIDEFITDLLSLGPPNVETNSSSHVNGGGTFGTLADPQITYFNNASGVTFGNGNASGYGIMIVENSLTLNGNLDFVGLVLVRGSVHVTQVTGSALVWGSIWTTEFSLTVGGHADIQYSSAGLRVAEDSGASIACEPVPTATGPTPIATPTLSPTRTATATRTATLTPTRTVTPSRTATASSTRSVTPSPTSTLTATATPTESPIETPTSTPTVTKNETPTPTPTPTEPVATATFTPDPTATPACGLAPVAGCRTPTIRGGSSLRLFDRTDDAKDAFAWRWRSSDASSATDFGEPTTTTAYDLCIYDGTGLVLMANVPAGGICGSKPCWQQTSHGFRYRNSSSAPDGVERSTLVADGAFGRTTIVLRAKGMNVDMPALPLAVPVRAQFRNTAGFCWEATFSEPRTNDGRAFSGRSD